MIRATAWIVSCALLAGLLWLLGRPASLDHGAVVREATSVSSTIEEARWIAGLVADGRSTARATATHAGSLATSLGDSAEMLDSSRLPRDDEDAAGAVAQAAGDASSLVRRLVADPADERLARRVADGLEQLARRSHAAGSRLRSGR